MSDLPRARRIGLGLLVALAVVIGFVARQQLEGGADGPAVVLEAPPAGSGSADTVVGSGDASGAAGTGGEAGTGSGAGEESPFRGRLAKPERPAPAFELTDATGAPFALEDVRGDVVLLFFGYTHCPDVCPLTLNKLAAGIDGLGDDAADVRIVFVSVDPERDTPDVIGRYLDNFDAPAVGVTGSLEALEQVAKDYAVAFMKEDPDGDGVGYTMAHTSTVFGIDPHGQLRVLWPGDFAPSDITEDVELLLGRT